MSITFGAQLAAAQWKLSIYGFVLPEISSDRLKLPGYNPIQFGA